MEKPFDETWFHGPLEGVGDEAELAPEEARHLRQVLRIKPGRPIVVSNGRGRVFLCGTSDHGDRVIAESESLLADEPGPPRLHVVMGLLKGRDSEEPAEGLFQLPIAALHLVTTDHTQEHKGQEHGRLMERLAQKSLVGLKQAKKPWLTAVHAPLPLRTWRAAHPGPLVLAHPGPDRLEGVGAGDYHLLSGPEGGFSEAEVRWLLEEEKAGTLGLGATRIRGSHAPLLACGKLMGLGLLP